MYVSKQKKHNQGDSFFFHFIQTQNGIGALCTLHGSLSWFLNCKLNDINVSPDKEDDNKTSDG